MTVTTASRGEVIASSKYNEIVGLLNGTAGYGNPVRFTQYDSSSTFSTIFGNRDTTNGYISRFQYGDPASPTVVVDITRSGLATKYRDLGGWTFNLDAYAGGITINAGAEDATSLTATDTAWTAAFAACVAVGGGTISLGPGTYMYPSSSVTKPGNVWIRGSGKAGTVLKHRGSTNTGLDFTGKNNVWLIDLTIDGNYANNHSAGSGYNDSEVTFQPSSNAATDGQDCGLLNVDVTNFNANAATINGVRTSIINCRAIGISLATANYQTPLGTGAGDTRDMGSVYGWLCPNTSVSAGLYMENCYAYGTRSAGFVVGGTDLRIANCSVENCHRGYYPDYAAHGPGSTGGGQFALSNTVKIGGGTQAPTNVTISNLHVGPCLEGAAVSGVEIGSGAKSVTLLAPTVTLTRGTGTATGFGIAIDTADGVRIIGGEASGCNGATHSGIRVNDGTNVMISGVRIRGNEIGVHLLKTSTDTDYVGITDCSFGGSGADANTTNMTITATGTHIWYHNNQVLSGTAISNQTGAQTLMSVPSGTQPLRLNRGEGAAAALAFETYERQGSAKVTLGLGADDGMLVTTTNGAMVLDQQASDGLILGFSSTDVASGITDLTTTNKPNLFGYVQKLNANNGGTAYAGLCDTGNAALQMFGAGPTDDTTHSAAGTAYVSATAAKKSGTGIAAIGGTANAFAVVNYTSTRLIVTGDGDLYLDATSNPNAWDDHDDISLLEAFRLSTAPGVEMNFRERFCADLAEHRDVLARTGVLSIADDGQIMYSRKALDGLLIDALRQMHQRVQALTAQVAALTAG